MPAPLSTGEQAALSKSSPIAAATQLGVRLLRGESLQNAGRVATGHIRLVTQPTDADTITVTAAAATVQGRVVLGSSAVFEFDSNSAVTPGTVAVPIGATAALTAQTLLLAVRGGLGGVVRASVHPLDITTLDVAHTVPGGTLTLSTSAPATRIALQANDEQQDDSPMIVWMCTRVVSAEDLARGRVRVDTGLVQIRNVLVAIHAGQQDTTDKPWNGTLTVTGGILEGTMGSAAGALNAGNVLNFLLLGTAEPVPTMTLLPAP